MKYETEALELCINGTFYAWDEDDNVYQFVGPTSYMDDGYRKIGTLPWPDDDNWETALQDWVNRKRIP
jgi:hypothetical protein